MPAVGRPWPSDDDDDGCVIHELQLYHNHDIDRLHCHLVIAVSWLKVIKIKIIISLPLACCSAAVFSDGGSESAHRSTENRKHQMAPTKTFHERCFH